MYAAFKEGYVCIAVSFNAMWVNLARCEYLELERIRKEAVVA
jgi:hypothetical protein